MGLVTGTVSVATPSSYADALAVLIEMNGGSCVRCMLLSP